jgi:hypothetical protein
MRYVEGQPVPAGYHVETRPRKGLVVAGAIVFGSLYVISASVAGSSKRDGDGFLLIPVFGPFIDLGQRGDSCNSNNNAFLCSSTDSSERFWLVFDGLGQAAGATMLIAGLVAQEKMLERDDVPLTSKRSSTFAWTLTPRSIGKNGLGLGVQGIF